MPTSATYIRKPEPMGSPISQTPHSYPMAANNTFATSSSNNFVNNNNMNSQHINNSQNVNNYNNSQSTKLLYDRSLSEWTSRYVKNKRELDRITVQCDQLRHEAHKLQDQVEDSTKILKGMENRYDMDLSAKFKASKTSYEAALEQKQILQNQIAENRRLKNTLAKERMSLTADYDRKYAELTITLEKRAKLDEQLAKLSAHLGELVEERKRGEKQLSGIQILLKENSELVDELNNDMVDVREGIKASVEHHMMSASVYHDDMIKSNTLSTRT